MTNSLSLTGILDLIQSNSEGEHIDVQEIVTALNSRGFGPLLVGPALIAVLPTGAIPGVPAICALLIIIVSAQILLGRSRPWLPARIKKFSFKRKKFLSAVDKARPYTQKIDRYIYPRFTILVQPEFEWLIALVSIALSIAIMILGFIPFLAALPGVGIILLGLGLSARDGLLLVLSFVICSVSLISIPFAVQAIF